MGPNGLKKQILQNLVLEAVLDKAMEDMLSEPTPLPESSDEAKAGDESKEEPEMMEEEEVKIEKPEVPNTNFLSGKSRETTPLDETTKPPVVKAPEPNSAFKSFFNSDVSLEELEAKIAASEKQREAIIDVKVEEEIQISK